MAVCGAEDGAAILNSVGWAVKLRNVHSAEEVEKKSVCFNAGKESEQA